MSPPMDNTKFVTEVMAGQCNYTECLCAELRKLSDVSGLYRVLVSVEDCWYSYCFFLLLMSLLIRDVAELEKVSVWKSDEILPSSVLLTCKQVEQITCILPIVWAS